MNHHQPPPEPIRAPRAMTCDRMESLLPLLDDGGLDAVTYAAALAHLQGCARCQRERGHYRALDRALRDRFGVSSVHLHTTEEIMRHITESANDNQISDQSTRPVAEPPRRRFAHSRSLRPWLSGLGAVAVVVLLLGMAAWLFAGRLGVGVGSHGGPPRYTFAGTHGLFASVSMISPTEGWALAQVTKSPAGSLPNTVTFYHYQNGVWTPTTLKLSQQAADTLRTGGPGGFNGTISMDSATDGWALASNFNRGSVLFHYTNGKWQEVDQGGATMGLSGIQALSAHSIWTFRSETYYESPMIYHFDGVDTWTQQTINANLSAHPRLVSLQMTSDSLGWAVVSASGDYGNPEYIVLQYAGNNTWTIHSTINAGNLGEISGLAMVSPDEGWAFGSRGNDGPSFITAGKPTTQTLFHYIHGKWQSAPLGIESAGPFVTLQKIVMRSADDGWIIAQEQNQRPGITASGIERDTILLHYDGSSWKQVAAPNVGGDASEITGVSFAGDAGWACGYVAALPDGQTIQDSDVPSYGSPMLWTYQNGAWVLYQQK